MQLDALGLRADYAADSEKSFVVMTREGLKRPDIVDFQVEMVSKNRIPGVLEFYLREIDLEMRFYYNVTGLISLNNFLKRRSISKGEFIEMLCGIADTLMQSKRYLLTDRCFLLDEKFIYIDPLRLKTYLSYIPIDNKADVSHSFKGLVNRLLIDCANIDTKDNFVQKVLAIIKSEGLCLGDFLTELKKLNTVTSSAGEREAFIEGGFSRDFCAEPEVASGREHFLENFKNHKLTGEGERPEIASGGSALKLSTIFSAASLGLVSALLFYGKKNPFPDGLAHLWKQVPGWAAAVGSTAGIIALIVVFIFIKKHEQVKRQKINLQAGLRESAVSTFNGVPTLNGVAAFNDVSNFNDGLTIRDDSQVNETGQHTMGGPTIYETDNPQASVDETVVLTQLKFPALISSNSRVEILIDKAELLIGRNSEMCDWVIENKSVGRAHARIKSVKGKCFVTDLDSTNGTFINGTKLISNKEYEINNNDKISFANEEFFFRLG